jgi:hypothetical protein
MWIVYNKENAEKAGFKNPSEYAKFAIVSETISGKAKKVLSWHLREDAALLIANTANQKFVEMKVKFERSVPEALDNDET